jgi:hypothetical protein
MKKLLLLLLIVLSVPIHGFYLAGPFATSSNISANLPDEVVLDNEVNTFTLKQTFSAGATLNGGLSMGSNYISNDGDSEGLSITTTGSVIIGSGGAGKARQILELYNSDSNADVGYGVSIGTSKYWDWKMIGTGAGALDAKLRFRYNGAQKFTILTGGTVGIGTESPATDCKLQVVGNIYPGTDDTYYLGKNDDDTPFAWKGIILKDQANGTYYRLQVSGNAVELVDLTD